MLTEMEDVAPGSLNKFLKGKMYNRCRRVHILFSTALHPLHFQTFMQDEEFSDELKDELRKWVSDDNVIPESLDMIALEYGMYCEDTMSSARGKTAKFWMIYCHLFHGAIKTCDVDLFTYVLHDMSKILFTTNHQNYAKCMTRYSLELLNLDLPLRKMLINGGLSVQRSKNHFSRVGVDMVLEQTTNAEAKSRLRGIIAFADVNTADNRWLITSSMRTEIVNKVLNIAGLGPNDDENNNKEVFPTRVKQDARDLENICNSIREMINPFYASINKDALFNIKTGRKVSPAADHYRLSVTSKGGCKRDTFINECNGDHNKFEKAITKSKIVNFVTDSFIKKNKSKKANKIAQLKGTCDLFACLLYLAIAVKDLCEEMVVTFPLTHEPAEFVHPDETIRTTTKSSVTDLFDLMKIGPTNVDTVIINGMFLLRNLTVPLPHTLRGLL